MGSDPSADARVALERTLSVWMRAGLGQHLVAVCCVLPAPAFGGDRDRWNATERVAGRRRDLAELRRTYGIRGETGYKEGATVSGQRLSKQARRVLRGDPSGGSNTPAPAVDSQNH